MSMSAKYKYLFPYEKIPQGSRIVIYGAGDVGQEYLQQMKITGYCETVAFIDRAFDKYPPMIIPVYPMEKVKELSYDFIVLAFKMGAHVRAVINHLSVFGVSKEKIIYVEPRQEADVLVPQCDIDTDKTYDFAYLFNETSIALKYGPGLGDAIVKKKIFTELVRMMPDCRIDIYCPGVSGFVESIYSDQKNLNAVIDDGGALYAKHIDKYEVALTLSFMIEIDRLNVKKLEQRNSLAAEQMQSLKKACERYHLANTEVYQRFVHFNRMRFLGLDYYTYPNYTGIFHILDHNVTIPLNTEFSDRYKALKLESQYITINYGGGIASSGKNNEIAKEWPFEYLEKFVKLFKEKYPKIKVVQLGSADTLRVQGADKYIMGESLELVKYVLRDSLLHIDKEGGLVHLATQLGTKCVVCFGPTQEEFFGYAENINIKAGNCHGCYCLYDGFDVCARGMEKPECMWSITPEMVMGKVEMWIESEKGNYTNNE